MYQILKLRDNRECLIKDGILHIPMDERNTDYREYQQWLAQNNQPEIVEEQE